jgi:RNA polymerase sigma-70 factor (ECF subfamily)
LWALCILLPVAAGEGNMDFLEVYDQHYERVKKFILAMVKDQWAADDLIQETFMKVGNRMDTLKDPAKISSWIYRIAYNLCQDHFRGLKREKSTAGDFDAPFETLACVPPQGELEQHQMGLCVQDKMNLLPDSLRTVLILCDVLEMSNKEIAAILDISVENVKVRIHRARKKLKTILEDRCTFQRDERNVLVCLPR